MKRFASLAGIMIAAMLGGCAVYPDGTPMYGNGYGSSYPGYEGYNGYAAGAAIVPQTNVYMGYSNYSAPDYNGGPGRYYGPGPGPRGYPDRGHPNNGNYGNRDNRGDDSGRHGPPKGNPPPQGAVGGPRGPGGSNGPRPGVGAPSSQPPQQAGNGGGRGNGNGDSRRPAGGSGHQSGGQFTQH